MNPFRRILVATDFGEASEPALHEAIDLAKESAAELLIAHAYQHPSVIEAQSVAAGVYEEWDRVLRNQVEERLRPIVAQAQKEGVRAGALILAGAPDQAITAAAKENNADLVVMGTHARKGVSRFLLGSVAARVVATAPCPVLTVRAA